MKCEENSEHLAAYLHDELSSPDEDSFQLHLSVCGSCRERHAAARDVTLRIQRVVPLEPSAAAREDLRQTIDSALRKPDLYGPPIRFRDGSEVRWRRPFALRPFASPLRKPPALPPPASSPSAPPPASQSGQLSALSPSAREVSTRLNNITRRRRRKPVRRSYLIALGLSCILAAAWLALFGRAPVHRPIAAPKVSRDEIFAAGRWNERHAVSALGSRQVLEVLLIQQRADLSGIVGDASVHVLPHNDLRSGECCLVLFRDADRKTIADDGRRDFSILDQEIGRSVDIVPVNGSVALPQGYIDAYIGQERIVVLKLDDRFEIWSPARLDSYLKAGPVFDKSAPPPPPNLNALAYYK